MKKNIVLIILLVLIIASAIGNLVLANKWIGNKNQVINLYSEVDKLKTELNEEKDNVKVEVEEKEVVKTQVPYIDIMENKDTVAQRIVSTEIGSLNVNAQYTKHVNDNTQGKEIKIYFTEDNKTLSIPVEKEVATMKFVVYGVDLYATNLIIIFTDGTAKITSYYNIIDGKTTLEDIDTGSKKAVSIESVRKYVSKDVAYLHGALVLEDGSFIFVDPVR